jgi:hypothetical protein
MLNPGTFNTGWTGFKLPRPTSVSTVDGPCPAVVDYPPNMVTASSRLTICDFMPRHM